MYIGGCIYRLRVLPSSPPGPPFAGNINMLATRVLQEVLQGNPRGCNLSARLPVGRLAGSAPRRSDFAVDAARRAGNLTLAPRVPPKSLVASVRAEHEPRWPTPAGFRVSGGSDGKADCRAAEGVPRADRPPAATTPPKRPKGRPRKHPAMRVGDYIGLRRVVRLVARGVISAERVVLRCPCGREETVYVHSAKGSESCKRCGQRRWRRAEAACVG
jgi:hypothetical protein